jgi:hypothetical protein
MPSSIPCVFSFYQELAADMLNADGRHVTLSSRVVRQECGSVSAAHTSRLSILRSRPRQVSDTNNSNAHTRHHVKADRHRHLRQGRVHQGHRHRPQCLQGQFHDTFRNSRWGANFVESLPMGCTHIQRTPREIQALWNTTQCECCKYNRWIVIDMLYRHLSARISSTRSTLA